MEAESVKAPQAAQNAAYTFHDMRLKVGDPLQVELPAKVSAERADSKLVGYLEGQSIIITAPRTARGRLELIDGEEVMVRTFTGTNAFAFRSDVIRAGRVPYGYLHLTFPERVESVEVRSSPRFRLRQPATATPAGGKSISGLIDDIGTTGAMVVAAHQLGEKGDRFRLDFSLTLHGVLASLSLKAVVRSIRSENEPPRWLHGVQFEELQDNDRLILGSLISYQMYENPRTRV